MSFLSVWCHCTGETAPGRWWAFCLAPGCAFAQEEHTESGATGRVGLKNQQDMEQFFETSFVSVENMLGSCPLRKRAWSRSQIFSLSLIHDRQILRNHRPGTPRWCPSPGAPAVLDETHGRGQRHVTTLEKLQRNGQEDQGCKETICLLCSPSLSIYSMTLILYDLIHVFHLS